MIALMLIGGFVIYLAITFAVTVLIVRRFSGRRAKVIAAIISVLVFFLIPMWDVIVGKIYFQYLCEAESGVRVYKTVELGPEYWFPDGRPRFITADGLADKTLLGQRYEFSEEWQENHSEIFHIKRHAHVVTDKQTQQILGRYISFIHFGGWLANSTGLQIRGTGCPSLQEYDYRGFLKQVFKPLSTRN
ncbi:hypothetical protein [Thiobacter aerophilum]|uniref:Uncharacterized protein n=1 Tax=Thiobacter aerophilum TaxID=3121275 RepID=A0ABV0ED06_9BURK